MAAFTLITCVQMDFFKALAPPLISLKPQFWQLGIKRFSPLIQLDPSAHIKS